MLYRLSYRPTSAAVAQVGAFAAMGRVCPGSRDAAKAGIGITPHFSRGSRRRGTLPAWNGSWITDRTKWAKVFCFFFSKKKHFLVSYPASAARRMVTMRSGGGETTPLLAGLPRLILSTNSMPLTTWPQMVYCPSRLGAGANMM